MKEEAMKEFRFTRRQEAYFLAMVSLFWFAQYVYVPYQTIYLTLLGVGSTFIGMVMGAYGMSQMLLRLPIGLWADSAGRHKGFLMAGTLASGLASVFRIFWRGGEGFLAANLFSGLASSVWISFIVFYTSHFSSGEQQTATSRIVLFNNFGMLLGFLCSTLTYKRLGMTGICYFSACAGLAAFLLSTLIKEPARRLGAPPVRELFSVYKSRRLWLFSFLALIQQGIQQTTAMSFTNQILKSLGASDGLIGVSSIIYMISAVVFSAFASSPACGKRGPRFWIPAVFAAVALYCLLVPSAETIPVLLLLQILPGISTGILFSFVTAEAVKGIPAGKKSTAMGLFQAVYALGMTVFPVFTGALASKSGMGESYLLLAGTAALGGVAAMIYYSASSDIC